MIGTERLGAGVFVTSTGTGTGKTFVSRGLARALARRGLTVAALKPVETGCAPEPADAVALGRACGRPELASSAGFYRARAPLAPYAATLAGEPPPPDVATLAGSVRQAAAGAAFAVVEGAGGLFVPLRRGEDVADLASALGLPLLVVAPDALGVLSHVRALTRAAGAIGGRLRIGAIVLTRLPANADDPSRRHNASILGELGSPVVVFGACPDEDGALADEATRSGLLDIALRLQD